MSETEKDAEIERMRKLLGDCALYIGLMAHHLGDHPSRIQRLAMALHDKKLLEFARTIRALGGQT